MLKVLCFPKNIIYKLINYYYFLLLIWGIENPTLSLQQLFLFMFDATVYVDDVYLFYYWINSFLFKLYNESIKMCFMKFKNWYLKKNICNKSKMQLFKKRTCNCIQSYLYISESQLCNILELVRKGVKWRYILLPLPFKIFCIYTRIKSIKCVKLFSLRSNVFEY